MSVPVPAEPAPGDRAARRARALAGLVVLAVVLGSLPWTVHPWYDLTNDGAMYLATARSLVQGQGYSYLGEPFRIRPPGFSCLIAPVIWMRGSDFQALNLFVSAWGAAGVFLFHRFLRERLGLVLATLVPLVLWFNPNVQHLCNQVMSDVPGFTALIACLLLERRVRARRSLGGEALLGLVLALASLLRSGDLILLPAIGCARLAQRLGPGAGEREPWRRVLARLATLGGTCLLALLPWSLRNDATAPAPPADQTLLYSYSTGMWHEDMGDPRSRRLGLDEVLARFPEQCGWIALTLGARLGESARTPGKDALAAVLVGALVLTLLRRREPEDFFALGTLAVVSVYFGYAGRLLLPVYALALAALVELVRDGVARLASARVATAVAALPCLALLVVDWKPHDRWQKIRELHEAFETTAGLVQKQLPEGARLGAFRAWHLSVFLERDVYGCERAVEREGTPAGTEAVIEKYGLDHLLLTPLGLPVQVQAEERAFAADVARRYHGAEVGVVRVR